MDKELTIAHMQGKFNMKVIYDVGHVVQEGKPAEVADAIYQFLATFRIQESCKQEMYITNAQGKKILISR